MAYSRSHRKSGKAEISNLILGLKKYLLKMKQGLYFWEGIKW